jgi:hypothetical protein
LTDTPNINPLTQEQNLNRRKQIKVPAISPKAAAMNWLSIRRKNPSRRRRKSIIYDEPARLTCATAFIACKPIKSLFTKPTPDGCRRQRRFDQGDDQRITGSRANLITAQSSDI